MSEIKLESKSQVSKMDLRGWWERVWAEVFEPRGCSELTRVHYEKAMVPVERWCMEALGRVPAMEDMKPGYVYMALKGNGLNTFNGRVGAIRSIARNAFEIGAPATMMMRLKGRPGKVFAKRTPLSEKELAAIAKYLDEGPVRRWKVRNRAMFEMLVCVAPRSSELGNMKWEDLNMVKAEATFRQKGGRVRVAQMPVSLVTRLQNLKRERPESVYVFETISGKCIHRSGLYHIINGWFRAVGIFRPSGECFGTHLFRHTLCTRAYEITKEVKKVQELIGHARVETTERYIHQAEKEQKELTEKLSRIKESEE